MHAKKACKLVMLQEPSYYSDIKVWLPEQQWGISAKARSMCIPRTGRIQGGVFATSPNITM
jgi:hypothetical protein|tara:strand:+ start:117 stop:299 length:183 start_codon:yes stop_codon:yes gene_type:complete